MANELYRVDNGYGFGSSNGNIVASNVLTVTANTVNLGSNSNVKITGGTSGQALTTDGSGNLSWTTVGGGGGNSISTTSATGNITATTYSISDANTGRDFLGFTSYSYIGSNYIMNQLTTVVEYDTADGSNIIASTELSGGRILLNVDPTYGIGDIELNASNILIGSGGGNVIVNSVNVELGNVSNIHITGGNSGEVLSTDGTGNLSWISAGGGGSSNVIYATIANIPNANIRLSAVGEGYDPGNGNIQHYATTSWIFTNPDGSNTGLGGISAYQNTSNANGNFTTSLNFDIGEVYLGSFATKGSGQMYIYGQTSAYISTDGFIQVNTPNLMLPSPTVISMGSANAGELLGYDDVSGKLKWVASGAATSIDTGPSANFTIQGASFGNYAYANLNNVDVMTWTTGTIGSTPYRSVLVNGQFRVYEVPGEMLTGEIVAPYYTIQTGLYADSNSTINLSNTANVALGNVANIHIDGGTSGQVLSTDGSGNLSWISAGGGGTPTELLSTLDGGNAKVVTSATIGDYGSGDVYTYGAGFQFNDGSGNYFASPVGASLSQSSNGGPFTSSASIIAGDVYIAGVSSEGAGNTVLNANDTLSLSAGSNVVFYSNVNALNSKSWDFTYTSSVTLGNVSNLHIDGGTSGQVLSTDGAGNLSWISAGGGGGSPAGNTTEVQFNSSGSFAASPDLVFQNIPAPGIGNILTTNITQVKKMFIGSFGPRKAGYDGAGGNISIDVYNGTVGSSFFTITNPTSDINMDIPTGNNSQYDMYDGQEIRIRFVGNSSATHNLTWTTTGNNSWREIGITLPNTIPQNKTMIVTSIYNDPALRWDVIDVKIQA